MTQPPRLASLNTMSLLGNWRSQGGENAPARLKKAWHALEHLPLGPRLFSLAIGRLAPYTGSIGATVVELGVGRSKVVLDDRPAVRNHLKCVHAIALCNLAELAGNVALAYSMPDDARFIVSGLTIDYAKKARGRITATGECPDITDNRRAEYDVRVTMRNEAGETVATASLRTLVGPQIARERPAQ